MPHNGVAPPGYAGAGGRSDRRKVLHTCNSRYWSWPRAVDGLYQRRRISQWTQEDGRRERTGVPFAVGSWTVRWSSWC